MNGFRRTRPDFIRGLAAMALHSAREEFALPLRRQIGGLATHCWRARGIGVAQVLLCDPLSTSSEQYEAACGSLLCPGGCDMIEELSSNAGRPWRFIDDRVNGVLRRGNLHI